MKTERKDIKEIELRNMNWTYAPGVDPILYNLNEKFVTTESYWIQGESGSGKSSLLRILAGISRPTSGQYLINGEDVAEMTFSEFLPYRLNLGFSFDLGGLINNRSLFDNLTLPLFYHELGTQEQIEAEVESVFRVFRLEKIMHKRPAEVTGRVRKILILARSLILNPQIILWDDPTIGLTVDDIHHLNMLMNEHQKFKGLKSFILITPQESFAQTLKPKILSVEAKPAHQGPAA